MPDRISTELSVDWVSIDQLFLNSSNPRINDQAVEHVAASIRRFGWRQPVVARPGGVVIAGNTRLKAARLLGHECVPVVWFEGTDLEATAYAIADNKTHDFSSWDEPLLAKLLDELRAEDSIEGTGFSDQDIDSLIAELEAQQGPVELDDQGPEEPPANPVSRTGDLWLLGGHKLLCGDSTKAADIERLMAGKRAVLLATDPPYCVNYTGMDRPIHEGKPSGKDWSHLYNEVKIEDLGQFLDGVLNACLPHVHDEAGIYMWHAHMQQPVIAATFERHGLLLHQILVWVKPTATFGHCYYRWRHEPCAFGWKRGNKPRHGGGTLETVWEVDWEGKSRVVGNEHPMQKPLRLFEIPMEVHTNPGDLVLEPFSGSGTQLLAAEKLHRRCYALDVQPAFIDVAPRRWEKATGKCATLEGSGKTFAEVAAEGERHVKRKIPTNAFEIYFAMGPGRSYDALADRFKVSKQAITKTATKERWQERVAEIEQRVQADSKEKVVDLLNEMNERHLRVLRAIQAKALETLKEKPLRTGMDAVRAFEVTIRHERLIRGEPSDLLAAGVRPAGDSVQVGLLHHAVFHGAPARQRGPVAERSQRLIDKKGWALLSRRRAGRAGSSTSIVGARIPRARSTRAGTSPPGPTRSSTAS